MDRKARWSYRAISGQTCHLEDILGFQRGMERAETLATPDEFFGRAANMSMFGAFQTESFGPRLFIDAISTDSPVSPSFYDGNKVQ